jgi:hypothetical protein
MAELTAGQLIIPNGPIVTEEQPMQSVPVSVDTDGTITTGGGRIVNTTRVTTTYTVLVTDDNVFCNTDGGDFAITLPALDAHTFRIINTGSGTLTITPDGTDLLIGVNESTTMGTGVAIFTGETTEGWW